MYQTNKSIITTDPTDKCFGVSKGRMFRKYIAESQNGFFHKKSGDLFLAPSTSNVSNIFWKQIMTFQRKLFSPKLVREHNVQGHFTAFVKLEIL